MSKSNPDDTPIITVGVSGPFARQLLADVARYQVEDALTTIDGVGQVTMMGYLDRAVRIWVDADKLIATYTTVTDITTALKKQHVTSSGGQMTNGQKAIDVRVLGEAADLDTLRNIVIKKVGHVDHAPRRRRARPGRLRGRDVEGARRTACRCRRWAS